MEPRFMNGKVIIARSFARIHETNLKKQGILPLWFADSSSYDKIQSGDRISVIGLAELTPGKNVICILKHTDGTTEEFECTHSLNDEQIAWFRAGGALSLIRARLGA